ncbi:hypothetical protein A3I27_01850 [Candidatus Giovannonibacteria bacterium RIFCSPLOWO2_02_FULL_43_11b]|uniref:Uncharacterized protein n=1 Tax=Candidatus Giovannonibacteria bacterium RIFCSPHIGHO2_12_FULL_43_15 TaxID=1798341 RepID=A0A1F5WQP1_9BACT|nr:MAG: hypothetical protein A2739_01850 [Candidatus Giovannonibacteria bacterium RIFCSPHIGHO2_01_FULL_43_100]OGF67819.1 MAG: hypothetical protein A3B97_00880 [Candidatus Giovannonibacteria bacterium RIFCSPHIGHO2_02_FULL_43_32]OGF77979.1 MAG: hypothetical protein A3F23_03235 [Candidatus Giovannonibacteria bacterium RIFCSPHIGHO2_12_FULL_43_15]OGF79500.1 MAG: hypothetical protein A3A15_02100 [Candidatus Giovannonibacteria bacterium RIFCSPLOWO2_01_FULL_43_60]OGF89230.1 MAG: hypothetical protein A3
MIKTLIIIILAIVVISLLGISIGDLTQNQKLKENFSIAWRWSQYAWINFIHPIWEPLLKAAKDIRG